MTFSAIIKKKRLMMTSIKVCIIRKGIYYYKYYKLFV